MLPMEVNGKSSIHAGGRRSGEDQERSPEQDEADDQSDHAVAHDVLDAKPGDREDRQRPERLDHVRGFLAWPLDRKSTRLNSSHPSISYAVFCLKKKTNRI